RARGSPAQRTGRAGIRRRRRAPGRAPRPRRPRLRSYHRGKPLMSAATPLETDDAPDSTVKDPKIRVCGLSAFFDGVKVVKDIEMDIPARRVTAIIGPSGCGKSTFLRCLNRMHEHTPGARVVGRVELDKVNVYDRAVDPVRLRRRVGMVFQ